MIVYERLGVPQIKLIEVRSRLYQTSKQMSLSLCLLTSSFICLQGGDFEFCLELKLRYIYIYICNYHIVSSYLSGKTA